MFQKLLKKTYEIDASEFTPIGGFPCCKKDNQLYILVPVGSMDNEELSELEQLANHLQMKGDRSVSTFLQTKDQNKIVKIGIRSILCSYLSVYPITDTNQSREKISEIPL